MKANETLPINEGQDYYTVWVIPSDAPTLQERLDTLATFAETLTDSDEIDSDEVG